MKIINNSKSDFRYAFMAFTVLLYFYPDFLFSQNTASASGNWNDCNSWGNPQAIFRNTTDTKTINSGIIITANENWSTAVLRLNGNSAVNMNGGIVLDFVTDQGNDKSCGCGAYVGYDTWKRWMCHNLGADMNADPFTPSAAIQGAKYQWGAQTGSSGRYINQANDLSNSGAIGWNTSPLPDGTWRDDVKTANDPCPAGYRVPTYAQWQSIIDYNGTPTRTGSWTNSQTNYGSSIRFGDLLLPAAGWRYNSNGVGEYRGMYGFYWSTRHETVPGSYTVAWRFNFGDANQNINIGANDRTSGFSVRCISE